MASPIYNFPFLYHMVMRLLHGAHFESRYRIVTELVPEGSSVVELCAGDAYLYTRHLKAKRVDYLGLDNSPAFVRSAIRRGIPFRAFDVYTDVVPPADVVIMQASLCQFSEIAEMLVNRMLNAARQTVLIAEPIRNLTTSSNPLLATVSRWLTKPHGARQDHSFRFDERSLAAFFQRFPSYERALFDEGHREMIGVFRGHHALDS